MNDCVLLVCNNAYAEYALRLARQIRRNEPNGSYDIVLASPEEITTPIPDDGPILLPIEVDDFIHALPANSRLKHFTYWRLPAIEAVSKLYRRVLYLDIDIYCAAPGISDLFQIDMQDKPLAAVLDVQQQYRPRRVQEFAAKIPSNAPYFNAGVLLIDGQRWLSDNSFKAIECLCETEAELLFCHDQSLLNLFFFRNWLELSPVWNWQFSKKNAFISTQAGPRLIHYAGARKIWEHNADKVAYSHWLSFDPARAADTTARDWDNIATINWQFFTSGLYYRRRVLNYLRRFPGDYIAISHS